MFEKSCLMVSAAFPLFIGDWRGLSLHFRENRLHFHKVRFLVVRIWYNSRTKDKRRKNMIKAPMVFNYENIKAEITELEGESQRLFDEIFNMLDRIDSKDNERRISLWLTASRGTAKDYDFEDEEEGLLYFEAKTLDEAEEKFRKRYPEENYWFKVNTMHDDEYRYIQFGLFRILIGKKGRRERITFPDDECDVDCLDLLQWLHYSIQEKMKEIEQGIYGKNLERNLPYKHRCGIILRSKFWELKPNDKEYVIGKLSQEDIEQFIKLYEIEGTSYYPEGRIKSMCFNEYFKIAIYGYKAMGLTLKGSLKEQFETYGEDFGGRILDELDMTSKKDFFEFFANGSHRGGHPWGIWRGSSRSRIMLRPQLDREGYCFLMSGDENWSCYEIVKIYLALKENDVPVKLSNFRRIVEYLQEKDYVGIVPYDSICCYCQSMFPNNDVQDFRHFHEEVKGMFEAIEWLPLRDYKLKE